MDSSLLMPILPVACAGLGLFFVGAANLLLLRKGFAVRTLASITGVGVGVGAAWALNHPGMVVGTAKVLGIGVAAFVLLGSGLVNVVARGVASLRHSGMRSGLLAAGGIATIVGSVAWLTRVEEQAFDESMAYLELMHGRVPSVPSATARAATDLGSVIVMKEAVSDGSFNLPAAEEFMLKQNRLDKQVIPLEPPTTVSNCHGWVFTQGRFCLSGEDVALILKENGYQQVNRPKPGDLVIYRGEAGITHTARVEYVTDGKPVLAVSKWGNLGVYLHPVEKTTYGTNYAFYRTDRNTDPSTGENHRHLLAGLGGSAAAVPATE
jgi:hypothetical protein